jgi:hypothetical protein
MYLEGGGGCVLITQPQAIKQARGVCGLWRGEGGGEGKVVEQQIGALGNPCSSFSSSSSLLCIRRGFDKNFTLGSAVQEWLKTCFDAFAHTSRQPESSS